MTDPSMYSDVIYKNDQYIASLQREIETARQHATSTLVSYVHKYCDVEPNWQPKPDLMGVLAQTELIITVTTEELTRKLAELEAWHQTAEQEAQKVETLTVGIQELEERHAEVTAEKERIRGENEQLRGDLDRLRPPR